MDIFADIARDLSPEKQKTLARFREAAKEHKSLPAELNALPSGFLAGVGFDEDDRRALFVLNPFGMLVAIAAESLTARTSEAA